MSFRAPVLAYDAVEHPNADALELAEVGDYHSACPIGKFEPGQKVAYIPEDSLVPWELVEWLGLADPPRLKGPKKNRVKAIRLRGVVSQGLIYAGPLIDDLEWGDDAAEALGLTKYEPDVPVQMRGQMQAGPGPQHKYDIENIKHWPTAIPKGQPVVVTEKIHGSFCCLGFQKDDDDTVTPVASSKGVLGKGMRFDVDTEENKSNIYVEMWRQHGDDILEAVSITCREFMVFGEVFGPKVQKNFQYGFDKRQFRVFDIRIDGKFLSWADVESFCDFLGVEAVPVLYKGPWDKDMLPELTNGPSEFVDAEHIREGCTVRSAIDHYTNMTVDGRVGPGRLIFKSVSDEYLTRKDGTEYN